MGDVTKKRQQRLRWYRKNTAKANAKLVEWRDLNKLAAVNVLTDGEGTCRWCGQGDLDVLCIDHINNDGNEHRRTIGWGSLAWWLIKNDYPPGFQVLCCNCNTKKRILHMRSISLGGTLARDTA